MDFPRYAAQEDSRLDLLQGALLIARDAFPGLDFEAQERRLNELAAPLLEEGLMSLSARAQVSVLGAHLNGDCGFRGNEGDYYDPNNSFLNRVLDRKLGIPISLAIVYIEVAKRAGVRASGVGFPGHFMVRVDDARGQTSVIVDPFSGRSLNRTELERLLNHATGSKCRLEEEMLAPAPTRHIVARMLMNLRAVYATRGDYARLLVVLDRLIDLIPDATEEVRDRGYLSARLGAPEAAIADLRHYVTQLPHAGDVAEVRRLINKLEASRGGTSN